MIALVRWLWCWLILGRAPLPALPPRAPWRPCVCSHGFNEHFTPEQRLKGCGISGCTCIVYVDKERA